MSFADASTKIRSIIAKPLDAVDRPGYKTKADESKLNSNAFRALNKGKAAGLIFRKDDKD